MNNKVRIRIVIEQRAFRESVGSLYLNGEFIMRDYESRIINVATALKNALTASGNEVKGP